MYSFCFWSKIISVFVQKKKKEKSKVGDFVIIWNSKLWFLILKSTNFSTFSTEKHSGRIRVAHSYDFGSQISNSLLNCWVWFRTVEPTFFYLIWKKKNSLFGTGGFDSGSTFQKSWTGTDLFPHGSSFDPGLWTVKRVSGRFWRFGYLLVGYDDHLMEVCLFKFNLNK